jgi:hypothetical protein
VEAVPPNLTPATFQPSTVDFRLLPEQVAQTCFVSLRLFRGIRASRASLRRSPNEFPDIKLNAGAGGQSGSGDDLAADFFRDVGLGKSKDYFS